MWGWDLGFIGMTIGAFLVLWLLVKVPFWAKDLAFSSKPSLAVRAAKTYVLAQAGRAAA